MQNRFQVAAVYGFVSLFERNGMSLRDISIMSTTDTTDSKLVCSNPSSSNAVGASLLLLGSGLAAFQRMTTECLKKFKTFPISCLGLARTRVSFRPFALTMFVWAMPTFGTFHPECEHNIAFVFPLEIPSIPLTKGLAQEME